MMADYYGLKGQSQNKCDNLQEEFTFSAGSDCSFQSGQVSQAWPYLRREHPISTDESFSSAYTSSEATL